MEIILETILWSIKCVLELYFILTIISVLLYWLMHFGIIGQGGAAFKKFLTLLHNLTEPVYAKLREHFKPVQGFDLSPYILIATLMFVLHILETTCQTLRNVAH